MIQHSLQELPVAQRLIAACSIERIGLALRMPSKTSRWLRKIFGALLDALLWFAHGCPRTVHSGRPFNTNDLAEQCRDMARPFLLADGKDDLRAAEFARRQQPDLVIVLGQPPWSPDLFHSGALGLIRVVVQETSDPGVQREKATELKIEHLPKGSKAVCTLAALSLPHQDHDGLLGVTLKCDLIADDLLVETAKSLEKGTQADNREELRKLIAQIFSPYLNQLERPSCQPAPRRDQPLRCRHRPVWKLCMQSLLLFPWITCRNLYRRLRRRYPVLILAHHLVSDRPHRMGMSTEDFWRRVQFLQSHYRIVSLSEATRLLSSGTVGEPSVVLTFDDGYCDNFITLRAVAQEVGVPIAMFISTQRVEQYQEFDHDLAVGTQGFFPLTWEQIRHWGRRRVEWGSHTRTHFDCGSSDVAELGPEIVGSRLDIELRLGQSADLFAFPFGKPANLSSEAMRLASSTYSIFVSSFGGENLPDGTNFQQHLLRKGFYADPWELELEMQSVFDIVQSGKLKLKRLLRTRRLQPAIQVVSLWQGRALYIFLLVLARLPHFRRLLDQISNER